MTIPDEAEGRHCYLRLPGVCRGDTATVVLCHRRVYGIAGKGQKAPDTCAFPACFGCHGVYDGRVPSDFGRGFLEAEADRAMCQWNETLRAEGYRLVKIEPKRAKPVSKILPRRMA